MNKFNVGDVVKYVGEKPAWRPGSQHIIYEVVYVGFGNFEYSTDQGAWFRNEDFILVRKADKESFAKLDEAFFGEFE